MNQLLKYFVTRLPQPTSWIAVAMAVGSLFMTGGHLTADSFTPLLAAFGLFHVNEVANGQTAPVVPGQPVEGGSGAGPTEFVDIAEKVAETVAIAAL